MKTVKPGSEAFTHVCRQRQTVRVVNEVENSETLSRDRLYQCQLPDGRIILRRESELKER